MGGKRIRPNSQEMALARQKYLVKKLEFKYAFKASGTNISGHHC
jgi:hypothetical protein